MKLSGRDIGIVADGHWHTKPYFAGIYAVDTLPIIIGDEPRFIIVNTDVLSGVGQHWVLINIFPENTPYEWFDSLGKEPQHYSNVLYDFVTQNGLKPFIMNINPVQSDISDSCGYFCLFVSDLRCQGYAFNYILDGFDGRNLNNNDALVENYVHNHMIYNNSYF